ncbi:glycoside hydrolase family 73 protein [Burkholderia cenocepacia]|uniref:glycoside hydrolase family 73 protein n=1 Tax=Burkholderia cenocepacia TaxID=95486 RepID=UPI002B2442BD|nr:glucosaminidase domain-containing protein [Burkholderia cenocepacia]MEB2554035.1 glucosaminidase domain-containing protein [Burkholderia cenocepacia]
MTPQQFIATIAPLAQQSMKQSKIPASFVVAEAALESGWGASKLTQQAMNLFGVKADRGWKGPTFMIHTEEYLNHQWVMVNAYFRRYDDWLGSIADHASFLIDNPRYAAAFEAGDGISFAKAVATAGYATDPQYAQKIISIINAHGLLSLDQPQPGESQSQTEESQ